MYHIQSISCYAAFLCVNKLCCQKHPDSWKGLTCNYNTEKYWSTLGMHISIQKQINKLLNKILNRNMKKMKNDKFYISKSQVQSCFLKATADHLPVFCLSRPMRGTVVVPSRMSPELVTIFLPLTSVLPVLT